VKVIEARSIPRHECLLEAGIRALNPKTEAALVMLGDMPQVSAR